MSVRVRALTVSRGDTPVLRDLDLVAPSGTSTAILGSSGSGKTTLLRTLAGLETAEAGNIWFDEVDVTALPASKRAMTYIPQGSSLQPRRTLADNVEQPLRFRSDDDAQHRRARTDDALGRFGLGGKGGQRAGQSSAGERQRASTARGSVARPPVVLLDEPLTAIDHQQRRDLVGEIREASADSTLIVATNDWTVAVGVADRVAVLADGAIAQIGSLDEVYDSPTSMLIAELTDEWPINRLAVEVRVTRGEQTRLETVAGAIRTWRSVGTGPAIMAIRATDLVIEPDGPLSGTVERADPLGHQMVITLDCDRLTIRATHRGPAPSIGSTVRMAPRRVHLFDLHGQIIESIDI